MLNYVVERVWHFIFPSEESREKHKAHLAKNLLINSDPEKVHFKLHCEKFRFLVRQSESEHDYQQSYYRTFVAGVLKGALYNLGVDPLPTIAFDQNRQGQFPVVVIDVKFATARTQK